MNISHLGTDALRTVKGFAISNLQKFCTILPNIFAILDYVLYF
jgi:hypothetical protein